MTRLGNDDRLAAGAWVAALTHLLAKRQLLLVADYLIGAGLQQQ